MYRDHPTAGRLPRLAESSEVPPEQHTDYQRVRERLKEFDGSTSVSKASPIIDGLPYAQGYFAALTNAPRAHAGIHAASSPVMASQGESGSYSAADHEWIDLIVGFDSGYWGLHGGHTANAITAGVRMEALEAVYRGNEHELTDDEQQVLRFIRSVRDGTMTDAIWYAMEQRLGTVRGTSEFAFLVCVVLAHHRLMWALGVPAMTDKEWLQLLDDYRKGRRDPRAATHPYVEPSMNRATE